MHQLRVQKVQEWVMSALNTRLQLLHLAACCLCGAWLISWGSRLRLVGAPSCWPALLRPSCPGSQTFNKTAHAQAAESCWQGIAPDRRRAGPALGFALALKLGLCKHSLLRLSSDRDRSCGAVWGDLAGQQDWTATRDPSPRMGRGVVVV